jgi:hypothetical protein
MPLENNVWAKRDQYSSNVIDILSKCFDGEITREDPFYASTLVVTKEEAKIIVICRIRSNWYLTKWNNDFTIRSKNAFNTEEELSKILKGYGDYLFYAFSSEDGQSLAEWFVGDLAIFRQWYAGQQLLLPAEILPGQKVVNKDGTEFYIFKKDIDEDFVVYES